MKIIEEEIIKIIKDALEEDIGKGDITTQLCVPSDKKVVAYVVGKKEGILCGIEVAKKVFETVNPSLKFSSLKREGEEIEKNERIAKIEGEARSILTAERVAINFLSFLSGVASYTRKFVEKVEGTKVKIMDTRKTIPNLRKLEKYAVRVGGGVNHREGLWEGILIKDNHLRAAKVVCQGRVEGKKLEEIFKVIRSHFPDKTIEIEVENIAEFKEVATYKPDIILLDNFDLDSIKEAVKLRNSYFPAIKLEVSGGVNLDNVEEIARCGVEVISIGSITHSSPSLDFSLEVVA